MYIYLRFFVVFYIFLCTFFAFFPSSDRRRRYIRYRDNIGYPRYGESYNIRDNQYSSKNLSYCPINRFLESVPFPSPNRYIADVKFCFCKNMLSRVILMDHQPTLARDSVIVACSGSMRTSLGQHARIGIIAVLYSHTTVATGCDGDHPLHPTTHSTLLNLTDLLHEDVAP